MIDLLIDNAQSIYYGTQVITKAYYDSEIVWGKEYLSSRDNVTVEGFSVGTVINKSNDTANWKTLGSYLPSIGDFQAIRRYWNSWGDDIFNAWGFPYVYDPNSNNYRALSLNSLSSADGVFNSESFTFNDRNFSVNYGYPVQGIFKIDVSTVDTLPFQLGFDGNLGSNGTTINNLLQHNYTLGGEDLTLHYNYNYQGANPSEKFYVYVVPYEINRNKSTRSYIRHLYNVDYLSLYTIPVSAGITVYISKQEDVKNWIINDLQIGFI